MLRFAIVLVFSVALSAPLAAGPVLFEEGFGTPTAGTYCEPSFPAGWLRFDEDGLTPHSNVAEIDQAWVALDDSFPAENCTAASTSWYAPAGTADDWLVTPLLHLPEGAVLSWRGYSEDPTYPDGYEVRYSLTDATPTQFMANPSLLFVPAEENSWVSRSIDLDAEGFAGRAVYLAFRNNTFDGIKLYIDDVKLAFDDAIFREEFGDGNGFGVCDPSFPSGWLRFDLDGSTPDPGVAWVTEAWVSDEITAGDCALFSTSAYVPAAQADDWLVSPPIALPTDAELRWRAIAYTDTEGFEDGYEVRWSATGSQPPDDFPDDNLLLAVAAENRDWTARSIDLDEAGLGGATVRFAFRNQSFDKDLLAIDSFEIAVPIVFRDGFESGYPGAWSQTSGF